MVGIVVDKSNYAVSITENDKVVNSVKLNDKLLGIRNINTNDIDCILQCHGMVMKLHHEMNSLDPTDSTQLARIRRLYKHTIDLKRLMQTLWYFDDDCSKVSRTDTPHCTCPFADNTDEPANHHWMNESCPIHNDLYGIT